MTHSVPIDKSWSQLRIIEGAPMLVHRCPRTYLLSKGTRVQFSTRHITATGTVLDIDHGAVYPLRIEYHTQRGDKRIEVFNPDEFITLKELP